MQEMIRDMQSSIEVQNLANLGYFDEEFQFYGCAYQINDQIKCLISEKEEAIYDFSTKSMLQSIYPTPIMSLLKRCKLPSGQKEAIKLQFKLALVEQLKAAYPPLFFDTLALFTAMPANDGALNLLLGLKKDLRNCYQKDELQLFEQLMLLAYDGKLLTAASYGELHAWLEKRYDQLSGASQVKETYSHTFSGFAYQATTGEINYYFNAQLTTTYHRKEALDQKNILTTPIFTKTYWLASFNQENLEALRVDYQETLKRKLNQNYLQLLQAIKSLPSAIDANEFAKQLALLHAQCPPESAQALLAYGAKWHVLF